jgi:hypothetical protein
MPHKGSQQYKWTTERITKLGEMYNSHTRENILKEFYPASWAAIMHKAKSCKFTRKSKVWQRKGNLSPLLEETLNSYYWMGFIAADGCLYENGMLKITLSIKDKEHLLKLAKLLDTNVKISYRKGGYKSHTPFVFLNLMDAKIGKEISQKFDLHHNKTYNPPSTNIVDNWTKEAKLAYILGYIDGDGHNNCNAIEIECHRSWKLFLDYLMFSAGLLYSSKINKRGYTKIRVMTKSFTQLKAFAIDNNLDVLTRKWFKEN